MSKWLFLGIFLQAKASDNDNNDLFLQNKQVIFPLLLGKNKLDRT